MSGFTGSTMFYVSVKTRFCAHCGQEIKKLNPHHVCKQKVELLKLLADLFEEGHDWVQVKEGFLVCAGTERHRAPYCARQHADRLKWFGLVRHRGPRTGEYQISRKGQKFLAGEVRVPKTIYCRDGKVVRESEETVSVLDVKGIVLDKAYWDRYASVQIYDKNAGVAKGE